MFITIPKYILNLAVDSSGGFPTRGPIKLDLDKIISFETEERDVPLLDDNRINIIEHQNGHISFKQEKKSFTKIRLPDNFIFFLPEDIGRKVSIMADLHLVDLRYIQMKTSITFTTPNTDDGAYTAIEGGLIYIMHRKDDSYFLFSSLDENSRPITLEKDTFYALLYEGIVLDLFNVDMAKLRDKIDRYSIALGKTPEY